MTAQSNEHKNQLYPVFLKLEKLNVLLVGAGNVGLEKLGSILSNSPAVKLTVVAPVIKKEVTELLQNYPGCSIMAREFQPTDVDNKQLIFLATDNPALHARIKTLAEERGILVNAADTPHLCDFYLGSIVQKGSMKIAISTNGKSPTIAKRIRELLNDALPEELDELLDNMQSIRNAMKGNFDEKVKQLNELTSSLITSNTSLINLSVHEK